MLIYLKNPCSVLFMTLFLGLSPKLSANPVVPGNEANFPAPFEAVLYARHSGDHYDRQAKEWEEVVTGDCGFDEAWFHYYKTAQYSNRFGSGDYDLTAILAAAEKSADPAGFDLNYLRFAEDKNLTTKYAHLFAAHRADPDRHEAFTGLAAYYTATGQLTERNNILRRKHTLKPIPAGVMEYNYNQLMSVAANGILITNGDSDTFPSWILQSEYGVRPDVTVISLPLLLFFDEYRTWVRAELEQTKLFAGETRDAAGLLEQLSGQSRPLFVAATGQDYLSELPADRLFITGLAFQYSKSPIDNLGQLAKRFNEDWRLENLQTPFDNSPSQAVADQLNLNYLPALFELHAYYQENPSPGFRKNLRLIQTIGKRAGRADEVAVYLRGTPERDRLASPEPGVRAKDIFKGLAFIPGGELKKAPSGPTVSINSFFMQQTEVSNADYQLFLEDLLRQRRFDLLDSVAIEQADLADLLPPEVYAQVKAIGLEQYNLGSPSKPIVNISHAAAGLYARWLTEVYNSDAKRKDGRNLRFRLATREEFELAFLGGRAMSPYPWGGPYFRNSKGCYLANFNTVLEVKKRDMLPEGYEGHISSEKIAERLIQTNAARQKGCDDGSQAGADGGALTVSVSAYFPNDYGLYNMAGNAAEMINEEGTIMGGSWLDPAYHMQRGVVVNRALPHPSTGFRLVATYAD